MRRAPKAYPQTETAAEALSEAAIDLAVTRDLDINDATAALIETAGHRRRLVEAAHITHVQRMSQRPSDAFQFTRALRIIERALQRMPTEQPSPFDMPSPRSGLLNRLRVRRSRRGTPAT